MVWFTSCKRFTEVDQNFTQVTEELKKLPETFKKNGYDFEQLERTTEFYGTDEAAVLSEERNVEQYTGTDTASRSVEQTVTNYELDKYLSIL